MSKKISLIVPNKVRPNLHSLFHQYIDRKCHERLRCRYDDDEDDYEMYDLIAMGLMGICPTDDDYDMVFPYNSNNSSDMNDDDAYARYWDNVEARREARRMARASRTRANVNVMDADYVEIGGKKCKKKHRTKNKYKKVDINAPYSGWEGDPTEYMSRVNDHVIIWFYPKYCNKDDRLEFNSLKEFDDFCNDEGYVVPPYVGEDIAYRPISHACLRPDAMENGIKELFAAESYADMVYEVCNVNELSQ